MENKNYLSNRVGLVFVVLAGILWSTIGLGIRLIEIAGVWQILLFRSISLTVFLFVILFIRERKNPLRYITKLDSNTIVAGLSLVIAYSGGIYAIQTTSVANAMLLFAAAPFLAAILGLFFLNEAVNKITWIAILFATFGIIVMVSDKSSEADVAGSLAGFFSAFGFASFTVALRRGKSQDMLPAIFCSGIFAILITLFICQLNGLTLFLSKNDYMVAMCMGVFQVGAGLVLYTLGSRSVSAADLALLAMLEVILGPFWVWMFLGETVNFRTLLGGSIMLLAIIFNAILVTRRIPA